MHRRRVLAVGHERVGVACGHELLGRADHHRGGHVGAGGDGVGEGGRHARRSTGPGCGTRRCRSGCTCARRCGRGPRRSPAGRPSAASPPAHVDAPQQRHHHRHAPSLPPAAPARRATPRRVRRRATGSISAPTAAAEAPTLEAPPCPSDRPSDVPDRRRGHRRPPRPHSPATTAARARFVDDPGPQPRGDRLREGRRPRRRPRPPGRRLPRRAADVFALPDDGEGALRAPRARRRPRPGAVRPGEGQGRDGRRPQGVLARRAGTEAGPGERLAGRGARRSRRR